MSKIVKPELLTADEIKKIFSLSPKFEELNFTPEQQEHIRNLFDMTFEYLETKSTTDKLSDLEEIIRQWYILHGYDNDSTYWFEVNISLNYKIKRMTILDGTCNMPNDLVMRFESDNTKTMIDKAFEFFETESVLKQKKIIREGMKGKVE